MTHPIEPEQVKLTLQTVINALHKTKSIDFKTVQHAKYPEVLELLLVYLSHNILSKHPDADVSSKALAV